MKCLTRVAMRELELINSRIPRAVKEQGVACLKRIDEHGQIDDTARNDRIWGNKEGEMSVIRRQGTAGRKLKMHMLTNKMRGYEV